MDEYIQLSPYVVSAELHYTSNLFFWNYCFVSLQVYDLETTYLQDPSQCGNVLKGFEGFLSSSKSTAL